jgi:hypothetical protein
MRRRPAIAIDLEIVNPTLATTTKTSQGWGIQRLLNRCQKRQQIPKGNDRKKSKNGC